MKTLSDMRPVYVVGIGLHPYQNRSQTSYVTLGLRAVREALADAAIRFDGLPPRCPRSRGGVHRRLPGHGS